MFQIEHTHPDPRVERAPAAFSVKRDALYGWPKAEPEMLHDVTKMLQKIPPHRGQTTQSWKDLPSSSFQTAFIARAGWSDPDEEAIGVRPPEVGNYSDKESPVGGQPAKGGLTPMWQQTDQGIVHMQCVMV